MKTTKFIKLKKLFLAAAAVTTLSAAFTSCKKDDSVRSAESPMTTSITGEFKEDHSVKFYDRDGNEFEQVHIHRYAWMTSNLKVKTADSDATPDGERYLYTDAMNGVCPDGWFIPSTDAWEDLKEEMAKHCNGGEPENISKAMRCNAWNEGTNTSALNIKPFVRSNFSGFWLSDAAIYITSDSYKKVRLEDMAPNARLAVRCVRNN